MVGDDALDGPTAPSVAQSFAARTLDGVIEFQLEVNFGTAIMQVFDAQGIPVIAIDIPMPEATFFGVNNPSRASSSANLPSPEPCLGCARPARGPASRRFSGLSDDRMITIDTTATIEQAFSRANSVLARIPPARRSW